MSNWDVKTWLVLITIVSAISGVLGYWMAATPTQSTSAATADPFTGSPPSAGESNGVPRARRDLAGSPAGTGAETQAQPTQEDQQDLLLELERRFRADKPDPEWARTAEKSLMDAAVEPALTAFSTPEEFKADCMGRMCRIYMHFETLMQAQDWAELYVVGTSEAISLARISVQPSKNGGADLIIFGARNGSESLMHMPARAHPEIADVVRR